MEFKTG